MHSLTGSRLAMTFHCPWLKASLDTGVVNLTLLCMEHLAIHWNKSLSWFARFWSKNPGNSPDETCWGYSKIGYWTRSRALYPSKIAQEIWSKLMLLFELKTQQIQGSINYLLQCCTTKYAGVNPYRWHPSSMFLARKNRIHSSIAQSVERRTVNP